MRKKISRALLSTLVLELATRSGHTNLVSNRNENVQKSFNFRALSRSKITSLIGWLSRLPPQTALTSALLLVRCLEGEHLPSLHKR